MPRLLKRWTMPTMLVLAVVILLTLASAAFAYPGLNSWSEKQAAPGLTQRTIYGTCQVYVYPLPHNVTHTGYIHAELLYKPGDYDCYIYLIDQNGNIAPGTEPQGYWGDFMGKEIVDYQVSRVIHNTQNEYGTDLVGDKYYIMVQAFDDVSKFQISGYYPRIDMEGGTSPNGSSNWYRGKFRYPASKTSWKTIYGAPYGTPFDFKATSVGYGWMQMRYPWNVKTKQPTADYLDDTKMAANFDQYLYPQNWSDTGAIWDYDWTGTSHWLLTSHFPAEPETMPPVELAGDTWTRCNSFRFDVAESTPKAPFKTLHYVPCLWEASVDGTGKAALKTGMSTVGYRADLAYPQNLYLKKTVKAVKAGAKATLKGTLAIDPAWIGGTSGAGTVDWAPAGEKVTIQRQYSGGAWKKVATATTGTDGAWSARVTVKKRASFRAVWVGSEMRNIAVTAQKTLADATKPEKAFTALLSAVGQPVWSDDSVDLVVTAIDETAGVTLGTQYDTAATYTADGTPFASPWYTLKAGTAPLAVTMGDGTKVTVGFVAVNNFSETSLSKTINVK